MAFDVPPFWSSAPARPRLFTRICHRLGPVVMPTAFELTVRGAGNVPASGPVILASNHVGILDGPMLFAVSPRTVQALTKVEMFHGTGGWFLRAIQQLPVVRQGYDVGAVRASLDVLGGGGALGIYPEAARGAGDFRAFKAGVAYLALCTGAPVVPVCCIGTRQPGGSVSRLPPLRSPVDVVFGPPIVVDPIPWPRRRAAVTALAARLQAQLAAHVSESLKVVGRPLPGPVAGREGATRPLATGGRP